MKHQNKAKTTATRFFVLLETFPKRLLVNTSLFVAVFILGYYAYLHETHKLNIPPDAKRLVGQMSPALNPQNFDADQFKAWQLALGGAIAEQDKAPFEATLREIAEAALNGQILAIGLYASVVGIDLRDGTTTDATVGNDPAIDTPADWISEDNRLIARSFANSLNLYQASTINELSHCSLLLFKHFGYCKAHNSALRSGVSRDAEYPTSDIP